MNNYFLLGQRPASMSLDAVYENAWIPDECAIEGAPRELFVQSVLQRFCGPMIEKLKLPPGTVYATDFALAADTVHSGVQARNVIKSHMAPPCHMWV